DIEFAGHLDPALVLFHDAVNRSQSESRALADFLGGEEGFEDTTKRLPAHPTARIAYVQANILAGPRVRTVLRVRFIHVHESCRDRKSASAWHGVAGIDGEVHDHLLDHAGVAFDWRKVPFVG